MQIRNVNGQALQIADTGEIVEPGDTVEVDNDLGTSLIEQSANWATAAKTKKETDR